MVIRNQGGALEEGPEGLGTCSDSIPRPLLKIWQLIYTQTIIYKPPMAAGALASREIINMA